MTAVDPPRPGPPPGVPRVRGVPGFSDHWTDRASVTDMARDNRDVLTTYGPTTRPGFVRIPVSRAIDLSLQRGAFPSRTPATGPAAATQQVTRPATRPAKPEGGQHAPG